MPLPDRPRHVLGGQAEKCEVVDVLEEPGGAWLRFSQQRREIWLVAVGIKEMAHGADVLRRDSTNCHVFSLKQVR